VSFVVKAFIAEITSVPLTRKNLRKFFCAASNFPYSFDCELTSPKCPEIAVHPGAAIKQVQGSRGGESESLREEDIEIGNG
jgi:hypothetical protein